MAQSIEERRRKNREYMRARHVPAIRPSLQDRVWAKVRQSDECWVWTGSLGRRARYPMIREGGRLGPMRLVHRLTYTWAVGPIPERMELDHLCRNRLCVRPDHLEPVTHRENMRRGAGWAGVNARKTHCDRHGFRLVNLTPTERGCRECRREDNRAYRQRIAAKASA